jgi:hypothetical protein
MSVHTGSGGQTSKYSETIVCPSFYEVRGNVKKIWYGTKSTLDSTQVEQGTNATCDDLHSTFAPTKNVNDGKAWPSCRR